LEIFEVFVKVSTVAKAIEAKKWRAIVTVEECQLRHYRHNYGR